MNKMNIKDMVEDYDVEDEDEDEEAGGYLKKSRFVYIGNGN